MPENSIEIRYGLINPEATSNFPQGKDSKDVSVRIFEEHEDRQWCTGILSRRYSGSKLPFSRTRHERSMDELGAKVAEAREEGKVPFRVAGPKTKVPGFLRKAGIAEIELVRQ